ncbi:MAG: hypothetical protein KDE50_04455 [Caldilineaceae bacterium]|nr:hypothetical protein [Caldilineaceae bacterium]MCB0139141.1 hypothetical protein [Caldilineaceae bacterium]
MQTLSIILFGVGGVGNALLRQIMEQREFHRAEYGLALRVVAVCDSNGAVIADSGELDNAVLGSILAHKESGGRLRTHAQGGPQGDLVGIVDIAGRDGAVVVDCTASDATVPALLFALDRGYKVVLANKVPLTVDLDVYHAITRAGATGDFTRHLGRSRWETTVGAGLPVIVTLNRLVASGDPVTRIAGTFSGTLGYVMTGLQQGKLLSEIVREAYDLGYTEPDPRDDLGGVDVARKALILARGLGWKLNMRDVTIEGLYPPSMDELSVPAFLEAVSQLDADFQERVQQAAAEGKVLRFAALVEDGHCRVGPTVVDADSPLGRLSGTDNLIELTTRWYTPNPLVVQGRGAGVDATAAGVLSDIVELAFVE